MDGAVLLHLTEPCAIQKPQVCNLTKWKDNPVSQAYGIHWIPTMVVIDPAGKVAGTAFTVKELKALLSDKI